MEISREDRAALIRDKYEDNEEADITKDMERLAAGEPLAYVIGWIPFLGLKIHLDSHPLIPRTETEWWTEQLIHHLRERFDSKIDEASGDHSDPQPFTFLDLCAGSGAIGLAVLNTFPHARVSFGELYPEHVEQIRKNIAANNLDATRAVVCEGNLFEPFGSEQFDVIATNPPYIPESRVLDDSVTKYEPAAALYAGPKGFSIISQIIAQAREHLLPGGEIWIECDIENIHTSEILAHEHGFTTTIHDDQYGRERYVVAH